MQTFLFYDIETTGLNKAFDQVLQFAAIRTDKNLKELERYELKIQLNKDIIPSPSAIITHQISIKNMQNGMGGNQNEYDAMRQIHQWFNQPHTISIGYNTLRFDDEFLRFSFYRNLLPPYTHQYANQCSRMDIYPMAVMYFLFKKNVIAWPEINNKPSFKLEEINQANQFTSGRSHEAMADVEATLALARCFFKEREMWDYLTGYFNKVTDTSRLNALKNSPALMVDGIFGADRYYQTSVLFLGTHQHYKNQMLWLPLDSDILQNLNKENVADTRVIRKKIGELNFILPFNTRFSRYFSDERSQLAENNKKMLERQSRLFYQLVKYHTEYQYPLYPESDPATRLYTNGFWTRAEENTCQQFHVAVPAQKSKLLEKIENPVLYTLALRLLGRHYPQSLTAPQTEEFRVNIKNSVMDYQGKPRLTATIAEEEITTLLQKEQGLTPVQMALLDELSDYLVGSSSFISL